MPIVKPPVERVEVAVVELTTNLSRVDRPETVRPVSVPTLVNDELTTAEPKVVAFKVAMPLMLRPRPVAKLRFPLT